MNLKKRIYRMNKLRRFYLILVFVITSSALMALSINSPDNGTKLVFQVLNGRMTYSIAFNNEIIVANSNLGLEIKDHSYFDNIQLSGYKVNIVNKKWNTVWGQKETILDKYNELVVSLQNKNREKFELNFRVFNTGVGFRYLLLGSGNLSVLDEKTEFNMASNNTAFWVSACFENDEYNYQKCKLSEVSPELMKKSAPKGHAMFHPCETGFNTPVTMKTVGGNYLTIHEAAIWNYPGFSLALEPKTYKLKTLLASKSEVKADIVLPFKTPWRVILLGKKSGDLMESDVVLNLNDPCKIKNTEWIQPMKYVGVWWEMHVKKSTWELEPGKNHGANTENVKKYIDFAARNGMKGVLVEGWNKGWENSPKDFKYTECYPDFDIQEVTRYAAEKGVYLIGHHETASNVENYINQMDDAYKFYNKYNVGCVKTGYVGKIKDHYHYDQWMVNHYNSTVTDGAKYRISVDIHEPIKPSGICRTYPNLLSGEGMRGQEQNAWSEGNDVNHNTILPFTRNLAGPMDFTPGIFDIRLLNSTNKGKMNSDIQFRVHTTLSQQLALYVVFYSPIQMAADLVENYDGNAAFQFIRDVPVDWKESKVIDSEIGEFVVVARKDRKSDDWYLGALTGENSKKLSLPLNFLDKKRKYEAIIYEDSSTTELLNNPESYNIRKIEVSANDKIDIAMVAGGGTAISFKMKQ